MTGQPPAPLVPAEVDLRGYEFMPLYGDRLFKSETWIGASPAAKEAMLKLWWHGYAKEVPAGSLPNDDTFLADYAGYGVAVRLWLKVKAQALRGWVLCGDGRLYHPFVTELAMEAWEFKKAQRDRTEAARKARLSQSLSQGQLHGLSHRQLQGPQDRTGQDRDRTENLKTGKALSGNPDVTPPNGRDYRAESREVLDYLNRATGRAYRSVDSNLNLITARLKSGVTAVRMKEVVLHKSDQWKGDQKMDEFLRPATLFNATKFEQYLGEIGEPTAD